MIQYLPGTTVEASKNNTAQGFLDSAFALNGLVLSQIVQLTGLEPHTVQNWIKRKFVAPPVQKKYDCNQFCRIAIINMLKDIFHIERIVSMLDFAKAAESAVDDMLIYIVFSDVIAVIPQDAISEKTDIDETLMMELQKRPLKQDTQKRLHSVLKVMVLAYISARVGRRADFFLRQVEEQY